MRLLEEEEKREHTDTEITLGMRSLLGIFFGLVLVCGVFFGLGYSLGRGNHTAAKTEPPATSDAAKPAPPAQTGPRVHEADGSDSDTYTPGPDAHEPINSSAAEPVSQPSPRPSATVVKQLTPTPEETPAPTPRKPTPSVNAAEASAAKPTPVSASAPPVSGSSASTATAAGTPSMVQVAAVSKQEDAEILVAALKKHGYSAVVRNDPKDSLLHVQIGPFATREEARATRAKLLADGYNAILK